jgi:hypothetical protein
MRLHSLRNAVPNAGPLQPGFSRVACGIAAFGLTVLTLTLMVILPALDGPSCAELRTSVAANAPTATSHEGL